MRYMTYLIRLIGAGLNPCLGVLYMFQTKESITDRHLECKGCGIRVVGEAQATDTVNPISLSYIPYLNKTSNISVVEDDSPSSNANKDVYYAWSYKNGSLCGITHAKQATHPVPDLGWWEPLQRSSAKLLLLE